MASLSQILGGKNPNRRAEPFLNQIGPQAQATFNPYIQQGNEARQQTGDIYSRMAEDPYAWLDEMYERYSPSAGYQRQKELLEREIKNTANLGGFAGTPYHQNMQNEMVKSLMDSDFQNYLNNITGIREAGLKGQQGYADRGYLADEQLNDILANTLQQRAGMAFSGQNAKNQNRSDMLKAGAQMAGAFLL